MVRSIGSGAPRASWPSGATSTARGGATRSIATRRCSRVVARVHELATLSASPASDARSAVSWTPAPIRELSSRHRDRDALRLRLIPTAGKRASIDLAQNRNVRRARRGRERAYGAGVTRDGVWAAYESLMNELDAFQRAADCDLAALLHEELRGVDRAIRGAQAAAPARSISSTCCCARAICSRSMRRSAGRFSRASRISSSTNSRTPIRCRPRSCCCWQPTIRPNATGAASRRCPASCSSSAIPKQAIYRFRRADVETYQEVCELLESRGAKRAFLHTSFRATPAIQHAVNAAFAPLMTAIARRCRRSTSGCRPHRPESAGQPSVVVLPVPEPYGQRRVAGYAIEKSLPDGRRRVRALAADGERLDGHRADRRATSCRSRCRSSRGTSASCSGASCISARM